MWHEWIVIICVAILFFNTHRAVQELQKRINDLEEKVEELEKDDGDDYWPPGESPKDLYPP